MSDENCKSRKLATVLAGIVFGFLLGWLTNMATRSDTLQLRTTTRTNRPYQLVEFPTATEAKKSLKWQISRFGSPIADNLHVYDEFILAYDSRNRNAHWVFEHISADQLLVHNEVDYHKRALRVDKSIHEFFRSKDSDYRRSGYNRGHMAAAANHRRSQLAYDRTFLYSNMCPQVGVGFNSGKWYELEHQVRMTALTNTTANVYVYTGPLYLPEAESSGRMVVNFEVLGKSRVAVPTHFFKAVLVETAARQFQLKAYILPNRAIDTATPLDSFLVPIQTIERAAGFLMFDELKSIQQSVSGTTLSML